MYCNTPNVLKRTDVVITFFHFVWIFLELPNFTQALHKLAKTDSASQSSKKGGGLLNPWPGYNFTGRLRPAAQVFAL